MNTLPLEVLYIISLHLELHILSVNKYFLQIYSNNWCNDYLEFNYPGVKTLESAKKLYYKSLQIGNVYRIYSDLSVKMLPIKGISSNTCGFFNKSLVLTFDNLLYLCEGDNYKLIDTNVINLDNSSYITHNKCNVIVDYFTHEDPTFETINIEPKTKFIKHKRLFGFLYVLTYNILYIVELNKYPSVRHINTIEFDNAVDIGIISANICILQSDGKLFLINPTLQTKTLCSNFIKTINNNVIDKQYIISKYKDSFNTIKLPTKSNNVLILNDTLISLNNNKIYTYKTTKSRNLVNYNMFDEDLANNVKNIYSDGMSLYIIK